MSACFACQISSAGASLNTSLSQKILLHYMNELETKRSSLNDYKSPNDKALLTSIIFNNPKLKMKQVFQIFGLKKLLESINLRELRSIFPVNNRNWYRLMKDIQQIKLGSFQTTFKTIKDSLQKFKPFLLSKFKKYFK